MKRFIWYGTSNPTDFAKSKALQAGQPIPMEEWDLTSFILSLIHMYSGWLPQSQPPVQAVAKFNCSPSDLDFAAWLKVYDLAPMLELDQFAAAANLALTELLATQYKGITKKIVKYAPVKVEKIEQ
ncbi:hypothetical protein BC828DRAFT_408759 [Blastocladiella britannica]|nr:hypothetical protein BC828DRAFT_408759 [Blastocladiella britannica]